MQIENYTLIKIRNYDNTNNTSTKSTEKIVQNISYVWIYDRSGSMSCKIRTLCSDIIEQSKKLRKGDTLTVCWFSGEGQNDCILKGFKFSDDEKDNFNIISKAINANNTVIGSTCFSESLINLKLIVNDLKSIFSLPISMCLFTDGYPVVSNYSKEISNIHKAIDSIRNDLSFTMLIGYGEYYNKQLMMDIAERIGGTLIHNSNLQETSNTLSNFVECNAKSNIHKTNIDYSSIIEGSNVNPKDIIAACSYDNDNIYTYDIEQAYQNKQFNIIGDELIILVNKKLDDVTVPKNDILDEDLYIASGALIKKSKTDIALDLLNKTGDKYIMDKVINAFTNNEYGESEKSIINCVSSKSERYKSGKVNNYIPNSNAFCLLDLLFMLMEDEEALFYPYHESFQYKKITRSSTQSDEYPKFKPNQNCGVPIKNLTWNKDKLNLSVLAEIKGSVDLSSIQLPKIGEMTQTLFSYFNEMPEEQKKNYPTFVYRNYTLIKNCIANMEKFPFTCSKEVLNKIQENGILLEVDNGQEGCGIPINILHLNTIPLINRNMIKERTSAKILANKYIELLKLEAKLKVYKEKNVKKEKRINNVPKEVSDFLITKGFKEDGSYAPPTKAAKNSECSDFYLAKVFKISVKGETLPKVLDVEKKIISGKKLNIVEIFMKEALDDCSNIGSHNNITIESFCETTKKEMLNIRRYIQETKFALILSKKWFDEFDSMSGCSIKSNDGVLVSFDLKEEKVMID